MNADRLVGRLLNLTEKDFLPDLTFLSIVDVSRDNILGQGVTSTTYFLPKSPNTIVKVSKPCIGGQQFEIRRDLCRQMYRDELIYNFIPQDDKKLVILANFLAEGVIGALLNGLSPYTPHFIETYGCYFYRDAHAAFLVQERGNTNWSNIIRSRADAYLFLFQVAHALYTAQGRYKFTHYDLHSGNLVYTQPDAEVYQYNYQYLGLNFTVNVLTDFVTKIVDFGLARMETDEAVVNLMNDRIPEATYGMFNPYYDFAILIGPNLDRTSELSMLLKNHLTIQDRANLLSTVFNIPIGNNTPDQFIERIHKTYYSALRPLDVIRQLDTESSAGILAYLVEILEGEGSVVEDPGENFVSFMSSPEVDLPVRKGWSPFFEQRVAPGISIRRDIEYFPGHWYNYTSKGAKRTVAHIVTIRPWDAPDFSFKTVCCKMDPANYLNYHEGVAINGGFFDVINTYVPIGEYRQPGFESDFPIPEPYRPYYGYILIDRGRLSIERSDAVSSGKFMAGPLLVWNGVPAFQPYNIERESDGKFIFQCQKYSDRVTDNSVMDCDSIRPGELSHGGNPNPRSVLITRKNGEVLFVVVTGRSTTVDGADFIDLVELCISLGADRAINLDGGTSSNIAFRVEGTVYNAVRTFDYAVGNILAFTRD